MKAPALLPLLQRLARVGPVFVVLCGPSHSGKSTLAQGLGKGFEVVSSDAIRQRLGQGFRGRHCERRVWEVFEAEKHKALESGRSVVLDACHMSKAARWHALQGPRARHRKVCVVFDVPIDTVRERCVKAGRVPLEEVERMWRVFQRDKPTAAGLRREGFDDVCFVGRERELTGTCRPGRSAVG